MTKKTQVSACVYDSTLTSIISLLFFKHIVMLHQPMIIHLGSLTKVIHRQQPHTSIIRVLLFIHFYHLGGISRVVWLFKIWITDMIAIPLHEAYIITWKLSTVVIQFLSKIGLGYFITSRVNSLAIYASLRGQNFEVFEDL